MKCPICPAIDIPDDSAVCPVCKADLAPLQRVRQLHLAEYNEAMRLAEAGAVDIALRHALAALAMDEQFVPAAILAGKLFWRKGNTTAALAQWEEATRLAPEDEEVRSLLASHRVVMKRRQTCRILRWGGAAGAIVLSAALLTFMSSRLAQNQVDALVAAVARLDTSQSIQASRAASAQSDMAARLQEQGELVTKMTAAQGQIRLLLVGNNDLGIDANEGGSPSVLDSIAKCQEQITRLGEQMAEGRVAATEAIKLSQDLQSSNADRWSTLTEQLEALAEELKGVRAQQAGIQTEQEHANNSITIVNRKAAEIETAVSNIVSNVAREHRQTAVFLQTILDSLKPKDMERLATEMDKAKSEIAELSGQGIDPDVPGAGRRGSIGRRLLEKRAALEALQSEWRERVEPWLRLREAVAGMLSPSANDQANPSPKNPAGAVHDPQSGSGDGSEKRP